VPDADAVPTELLELFQRAQAAFTDRIDAVEPGQWDLEALPGWTVADLVAHLVGEAHWVPALLAGDPYDDVAVRVPAGTDALLAPDPLTAWEAVADEALAAVAAADLVAGTVHLSRGPTPVAEYVEELTADLTVHSWDLAAPRRGRGARPGAGARGRGDGRAAPGRRRARPVRPGGRRPGPARRRRSGSWPGTAAAREPVAGAPDPCRRRRGRLRRRRAHPGRAA
jgi:uncharacterized protein (TIGR03086 family)